LELTDCALLHWVQMLRRPRWSWAFVIARAGGPCAGRGVYAGAALSAAVLAATGAMKESAGADGVAVRVPATRAL